MDLKSLFSNVLAEPLDAMNDDTSPRTSKNWDSARHIELVLAIEAAYGIQFSMPEMTSLHSLGDVRKILETKGIAA